MRAGDFEAALAIQDRVLDDRDPSSRDDPELPYHRRWVWDGRPVDGENVLVRCYHGLGDTVMFARYLPALAKRSKSLLIEAQPELVPLLRLQPWAGAILPFRTDAPLPTPGVDLEIMECAHVLREPPDRRPYLSVNASTACRRSARARVGICWQASRGWSPERSVPTGAVEPLLDVGGVELVSLQLQADLWPSKLANDCPASIVGTARRIVSLDVVITVDTLVAHLAGALGVPVWLLLHDDPDWRWLESGGSLWYRSVRTFRQSKSSDWAAPVEQLRESLVRLARSFSAQAA